MPTVCGGAVTAGCAVRSVLRPEVKIAKLWFAPFRAEV